MIKIISVLFFLFFVACSFKQPKYCKLSDDIYFSYNKEICRKNKIYLVGKGGAMMNDIQTVNAHYVSLELLTIEQARRLYVDVIEGYLCRYNQNVQIRPYLHDYPFTVENLDVTIRFENGKRAVTDEELVALIYVGKNNQVIFRAYDLISDKYTPLYTEPYETARDIVLKECRCP